MKRLSVIILTLFICIHAVQSWAQELRSLDPGSVQRQAQDTRKYFGLERRLRDEKARRYDEDIILRDQVLKDRVSDGQVPRGRVQKDQIIKDKVSEGRVIKDRVSKDRVLRDQEKTRRFPSKSGEEVIFINRIETGPSGILSPDEIREITAPYEGREAGIDEISTIIKMINELYETKDFIAAKAVLPPQKIEEGVVTIKLIEDYTEDMYADGRIELEDQEEAEPLHSEPAERIIFISRIETDPSKILSPDEIREITAPYEGREADIKEIFAIIERINELYSAKNFITAKAVLPTQRVEEGIIRIKLIEAHLGRIHVDGNKYTRSKYFQDRISTKTGTLIDVEDVRRDLLFFNRTNDVNIKAELGPGEDLGLTDIFLKAYEPNNYQLSLFADNAGRDEVGRERIGFHASDLSVLGHRDHLSLGGYYAKGTTSGYASYDIPLTSLGTRLGLSAQYTEIEITEGPFEDLKITGDSYNIGAALRQPVLVRQNYDLGATIQYVRKKSATDFDDFTLFETTADCVPFGIDLHAFGNNYEANARVYSSHVSYENFNLDDEFFKYNISATAIMRVKESCRVMIRLDSQYTDADLIPSFEQFQVGGLSSVRGFDEGVLIGDKGYFISAELNFPLPFMNTSSTLADYRDKVRGIVFIDHGGVSIPKGQAVGSGNYDSITSTGAGLSLNLSRYFIAKPIVGVPLSGPSNIDDDITLLFYLQSNIF